VKITLKTSEAARHHVSQLLLEIKNLVDGLENGKFFMNLNDSSSIAAKSDCVKISSQVLSPGPLKNMLLKCMIDADSSAAGGSFIVLKCLSMKNFDYNKSQKNRRFSLLDLEKSLSNLSDKKSARVTIESIKRAGRDGKIILDKAESSRTEIIFGSQQCSWHAPVEFFSNLKSDRICVNQPRLVFIDGIIESVAECHKFFQDSNENLNSYVIFARGFSGDVISTAAVNAMRGTAHIIPVEVTYDEVGCNSLADLATGFRTDVVSSLKGELISSIDLESCPKIERATAYMKFTELESLDNNMSSVVSHISEKIKRASPEESDILRKRMSSLGAGALTIRVGKDSKSLSGISRDRIDYCVRYCMAALGSGLSDFFGDLYPASSIESGRKSARSFLEIMSKNGAILMEEKSCG
jgi:hypothetical protein